MIEKYNLQSVIHCLIILIKPISQELSSMWYVTDKYQDKVDEYLPNKLQEMLAGNDNLVKNIFE